MSSNPFLRPSSGGRLENKDYTRHIRWTPLKIAIFAICIGLPYLAIVIAIFLKLGVGAAIPLVVLAALTGIIVAILYRLSRAIL